MPAISVIVPVYKVEEYLPACIDSVLAQTFSDFELILIDDGSPDNCGVICDKYATKDSRIIVIHQENGGVSNARNTALQMVTGKYLTFCDSDDFYAHTWLEDLISAIQASDADVSIGCFTKVDEDGKLGEISKHEVGIHCVSTLEEKVDYNIQKLFGGKHGWEVWTRLFRTDIILNNHIRFCESCSNFAEDLGFVLEYMLYASKAISISSAGYHYRLRSGSMMRTSDKSAMLDSMNEVSLHYANVFEKCFSDKATRKFIPIMHFLIMHNQYCKIIGTEQYPYLKQQIKSIRCYKEWRSMTAQIFGCYHDLIHYFGKTNAQRLLLFSNYCLHGNWKRFTIESAIAYKWFIKEK